MSALLDAALYYAEQGLHVFPLYEPLPDHSCSCGNLNCEGIGKHPRTPHGFTDASTDEAVIRDWWRRWPEANIGVQTGDGLLVLDVDERHGGEDALHKLEDVHGALPQTAEVVTGGGRHLWFRLSNGQKVRCSEGQLAPGLDVRAEGGYVVAPPSLHSGLKRYSWELTGVDEKIGIAPVPPWLLEKLTTPPPRGSESSGVNPSEVLKGVPEGKRDDTLFRYACSLRRRWIARAEAATLVLAAARVCRPPFTDKEALEKIEQAWRYPPGGGTFHPDEVEVRGIAGSVGGYPTPAEEKPEPPPDPAAFLRGELRNVARLKTGFPTLDQATRGGIPAGIVTALIGAPHSGKTAFASQIAIRAASEGYLVVILFKDEGRFAGAVRLGQQFGLERTKLENQDPDEIERFADALIERDIRLPDGDSAQWNLENLISWLEAEAHGGPRLLIVDTIQSAYAKASEDGRSLREEIEAKMRLLEGAAKRGALVIVASEMSRSAYRHKNEKENIRGIAAGAESRAIEYVSRLILTLEGDAEKVITAKVEKNSPGGKRPVLRLKFDPTRATFREISEDEAESEVDESSKAEEQKKRAKLMEKIRKALREHLELSVRGLEREVKGDKERLAEVRDEMVEDGLLLMREKGPSKLFRLPDVE